MLIRSGVWLRCGHWLADVEPSLCEAAVGRCHVRPFLADGGAGEARLRIERVDRLASGRALPLDHSLAPWGFFEISGECVRAHIPDDAYAAESVLRVLFQIAIFRQGGFLIHGAGVGFGAEGIAATGPSGAGKSTLSTLCTRHAGGRLLSDEIVALFPDGTCIGTPFRSNAELVGSPDAVKLRTLFLLEKGPDERIDPVDPREGARALLSQMYRPIVDEVSRPELLGRVNAFLSAVGVRRLTFRKDPAAGAFVERWVRDGRV